MSTKKKKNLLGTRLAFKPFSYDWAFDAYLKSEQMHWIATEIPMMEDVKDWTTRLTPQEKMFLTNIFRFFVQSDIDVAGGYISDYLPHFKHPELRMMLCSFAAREAVHVHAYSHLIETLGMPESTYNEFLEHSAMREKHEYFESFTDGSSDFNPLKVAAISAFTEGLALFSSFIMLLNFPRFGKMRGMGQIISWSIADEQLHCDSMIKLFRTYIEENRHLWNDELKSKIYSVAEKMVYLEDAFIDMAFDSYDIEGLTNEEVKKYIRYIADRRLIQMGMKGLYKVKKNPLPWVEGMLGVTHSNFFENKVVDYAKGALTGSWEDVWAK